MKKSFFGFDDDLLGTGMQYTLRNLLVLGVISIPLLVILGLWKLGDIIVWLIKLL